MKRHVALDLTKVVALSITAATLFVHGISLVSGEQAAIAIQPFAGQLAGVLFAIGILNAGFMGLVIVSLSTAYAFAEFFGLSGSLDDTYQKSKTFYILFVIQLIVATMIALFIPLSLFKVAVVTQTINAVALPLVFYYLIKLTNDRVLMGKFANNNFQRFLDRHVPPFAFTNGSTGAKTTMVGATPAGLADIQYPPASPQV